MNDKREFFKTILCGAWVTPIVVSVALPAHAVMSGMNFRFDMSFTENCMNCNVEMGGENGEITALDPALEEELIFEVFDGEIESGEFTKTFDFNGDGPMSDFSSYKFSVTDISSVTFSGLVERSSVDNGDLLRGNFEANNI